MENWYRFISGAAAGAVARLAPVAPPVGAAVFCIAVDFVTGILADRAEARRAGRRWYFESCKAWRTVVKLALTLTMIVMAWLLDRWSPDFLHIDAVRLCTGFACGVEFWSFLENAAQISDAPLFRLLRRFVRRRIAQKF